MKVREHSLTSVIYREALELHTKRNLKLKLVNSTSSELGPPPLRNLGHPSLLWSVALGVPDTTAKFEEKLLQKRILIKYVPL